ncbi:MAG: response regulator transcription factor [Chloroflexi bacterium]|jgi:two-component system, NarL family, response regulator LiaR|nr:response regulator transcription factor [Chloroflexota bacterium]
MTTKILIVDDHPVVSEGIRKILDTQEDMEVVGQAADGEEALKLAEALKPDLVVMDVMMPELDGIETTKRLKTILPSTAVLLLSAYSYESYLLAAIRAGAAGFLSKSARKSELLAAIEAIISGEQVFDQKTIYKILNDMVFSSEIDSKPKLIELHDREMEVLRLAAKGKSNKEIGRELVISERTVQTHLTNVFRKFNVSSRTEAVLRALKQGLITLEDVE